MDVIGAIGLEARDSMIPLDCWDDEERMSFSD